MIECKCFVNGFCCKNLICIEAEIMWFIKKQDVCFTEFT